MEEQADESSDYISQLPTELISLILSHLDFRDQINFSSTCKKVRYSFRNLRKKYNVVSFQGSPSTEWYMIDIKTHEYTWRREFFSNYRSITEIKSTIHYKNTNEENWNHCRIRGIRPGLLVEKHFKLLLDNVYVESLLLGLSSIVYLVPECRVRARVLVAPFTRHLEEAVDHLRPTSLHISSVQDNSKFFCKSFMKDYIQCLSCENVDEFCQMEDLVSSKLRSLTLTTEFDCYKVNDILTFLQAWRNGETKLEHFKVSGKFHVDLTQCPGFEEAEHLIEIIEPAQTLDNYHNNEHLWKIKQYGTGREAYIHYENRIVTFTTIVV